ncbi:hypothetical protein SY88_00240 [Clostridiales bacterium PH28_bin88]|nr:hypothetical protein SY88_00240 [Clostridiales bacterium PH28_bin88]
MLVKDYLVPRAVTARMEIFPGFGLPELGAVVAGGAAGALLQTVALFLPLAVAPKLFARLFLFVLPLGAAYLLVHQDISGFSLYSQLKAARQWSKMPRVYYYRRGGAL